MQSSHAEVILNVTFFLISSHLAAFFLCLAASAQWIIIPKALLHVSHVSYLSIISTASFTYATLQESRGIHAVKALIS